MISRSAAISHSHEAHCPLNSHHGKHESIALKGMHHPAPRNRGNARQDKPVSNNHHEPKKQNSVTSEPESDRLLYLSSRDYIPHVDETPRKPTIIVNGPENEDKFIRINVGGSRFCIRKETLVSKNEGLLSLMAVQSHESRLRYVDAYFEATKEYYFERSSTVFNIIYQYYSTGKLHQAAHVCPEDLIEELNFWRINPERISGTCMCTQEIINDDSELESLLDEESIMDDEFKNIRFGDLRQKIWTLIEDPSSSFYAQIFASFSILFVVISIAGLILGSLPELQVPNAQANKTEDGRQAEMEPHPYLVYLENVCIVWFIFEYSLKMLVSPNRCRTFCQVLNIIDLLAILPFICEISMLILGIDTEQLRDLKGALLVVRILRVLRVIRVLKLGRYSSGLQMFGKTLRASFRQLGMMLMVVLTGVIFFSTLIFYLEKDENAQFSSIPAAFWFSIATMSTVGYGDITPKTSGGKVIATAAIACGILVLALPITIIVDNFMRVADAERHPAFQAQKGKQMQPKKKELSDGLPESLMSKEAP